MPDQDRRRHPRTPVRIDITYDNDVLLTEASVKDLSLGGANISTALPLPVGTPLSLSFRGAELALELKGRVQRVTEEDPDDEATQPGMGVQFFGVSSKEEASLQELIEWYLAQPPEEAAPAPEELPQVEEASEQRYIETQILHAVEAAPEATVQIKLPVEVSHPEAPVDLEATQIDNNTTAEFEVSSPFESPNPFEAPPSDESIQTIRISPEELEAQRAARANPEATAFETVRMHPEDLNALQSAAQSASETIDHEHSSDTITTLPEMPAFVPNPEASDAPADSGERKAKKKRKR